MFLYLYLKNRLYIKMFTNKIYLINRKQCKMKCQLEKEPNSPQLTFIKRSTLCNIGITGIICKNGKIKH